MRARRPPPLARITWLDAHQLREEGELTAAEAVERAHAPLTTTTCGYLLQSDATGVTLASEIQAQEEEPTFRTITFIPRGMIVREAVPPPRRSHAKACTPRKKSQVSTATDESGEKPTDTM